MIAILRAQVSETFFNQEKNQSYITLYDLDQSCSLNLKCEGKTDLVEGQQIDVSITLKSSVFKGSNSLLIKKVVANKPDKS